MNFSAKNKTTLQKIADEVGIEVEAKKKGKPTLDELIAGLEEFEKEDPEAVKAAVEKLGINDEPDEVEKETKGKKDGEVFTYVGKGEESPNRINFMGKQEFVRGRPTEVTDPDVLRKIRGNPTFVEGEADAELLQQIEDEGAEHSNSNRKADKIMDAVFKKNHKTE